MQAVVGRQAFGPIGLTPAGRAGLGAREHLAHHRRVPALAHQCGFGHRRRRRGLDGLDELVDVGQCHRQPFEHVATFACLAQLVHGAPRHNFAAVIEEDLDQRLQVAQLGLAVDQRHHVDAEAVLKLSLLVQIVQHHLGYFAALELDHYAHAGLVALVLDVADAVELLLLHQLGNAFEQRFLVDLIRDLVNDDRLACPFVDVFEVALGAHHDAAAAGAVALAHTMQAIDDARGGEVGRGHDLHQLVDRRLRPLEQVKTRVHDFVQVVRRDVGGHAHGNAGGTVDQQVGQARRQHHGLFLGAVVVGCEVDGVLVDVGQHFVRDLRKTDLGVAHRRRVVAIDGAKIALAVHQHVAQRKVLRHAHDGVVHRGVAMRVVLADDVAYDPCRLFVRPVPVVVQLVHGKEHAPMHRLQAITRVGQRTPDDHAHRVVQIRAAHLLFEADGQRFFGEGCHAGVSTLGAARSDMSMQGDVGSAGF